MSYSPIMTGGVIVEVPKIEYAELIRESEQLAAIKRLVEKNGYIGTSDIIAILGIEERAEIANEKV